MAMSSMPSSSSSASMSGMDHGSMPGMDHGSTGMTMVFFTATDTPLYSTAFTPHTTGQYAGICVFLIALAFIFRGLIALRCNALTLWAMWRRRQDTRILLREPVNERLAKLADRPWRINEAAAIAVLDVILVGVGYLLMLAVMTMNVGYFMSVLGGTFLGSFIVGRWTGAAVVH
ncbi:uncharacterized protein LTR77_005331 [Saxophila tyrrhenica]|uniref:Copper transport protein n=1 Tax=Saxophila tyrrhenica TaxID=1690608 RepID=A0AAV9PAD5_9PEZI|nr:hypothetical protein LTR77_005331 [Saxophila tyrrhenica]